MNGEGIKFGSTGGRIRLGMSLGLGIGGSSSLGVMISLCTRLRRGGGVALYNPPVLLSAV